MKDVASNPILWLNGVIWVAITSTLYRRVSLQKDRRGNRPFHVSVSSWADPQRAKGRRSSLAHGEKGVCVQREADVME